VKMLALDFARPAQGRAQQENRTFGRDLLTFCGCHPIEEQAIAEDRQ